MSTLAHYEISPAEAERRITHTRNRARNLRHEERVSIAVEAHYAKAKEVADRYGISPAHVYQIKGAHVQTRQDREILKAEVKDEVKEFDALIESRRRNSIELSTQKLLETMGAIKKENLEALADKPKLLASIARDLSTVTSNLSKKEEKNVQPFVFHIHGPATINESELGEPIEVSATVVR